MDIRIAEHEKRIALLGLKLFRKKIGKKASPENVSTFLRTSKNDGMLELLNLVDFVVDNTTNKWQCDIVKGYMEFGIFLSLNHPELRKGLNGLLKQFTKYDGIEIDLEPSMSKTDIFLLEHILKYVTKQFSSRRTFNAIMSESFVTTNKVAQNIMSDIDEVLKEVNNDFLQRTMKTFLWFVVWVGINDTAYRHQFYYMLNKCGNKELSELSEEFYREPNMWFINLYSEGKAKTRELWRDNKIPRHEVSVMETPCVVKFQQDAIIKHNKKYGVK